MTPVVIDTNCLLQIISRRSPYRPIWDAFLAGCFTLCASDEILDEYQEIIFAETSARCLGALYPGVHGDFYDKTKDSLAASRISFPPVASQGGEGCLTE